MKKIIIGTFMAIAAVIAAILIAASMQPDTFQVTRSIIINAKPGVIAAQIADFRKWISWSPYEKYDPAMKRTYSGPGAGIGAVYGWEGDSRVGAGRMEIVNVTPGLISIKLDFFKPMTGHNTAEFRLEPAGESTKLTWTMRGLNRFIAKIFHLFIDMDRMVGSDFEAGLQNLKAFAER